MSCGIENSVLPLLMAIAGLSPMMYFLYKIEKGKGRFENKRFIFSRFDKKRGEYR